MAYIDEEAFSIFSARLNSHSPLLINMLDIDLFDFSHSALFSIWHIFPTKYKRLEGKKKFNYLRIEPKGTTSVF